MTQIIIRCDYVGTFTFFREEVDYITCPVPIFLNLWFDKHFKELEICVCEIYLVKKLHIKYQSVN